MAGILTNMAASSSTLFHCHPGLQLKLDDDDDDVYDNDCFFRVLQFPRERWSVFLHTVNCFARGCSILQGVFSSILFLICTTVSATYVLVVAVTVVVVVSLSSRCT